MLAAARGPYLKCSSTAASHWLIATKRSTTQSQTKRNALGIAHEHDDATPPRLHTSGVSQPLCSHRQTPFTLSPSIAGAGQVFVIRALASLRDQASARLGTQPLATVACNWIDASGVDESTGFPHANAAAAALHFARDATQLPLARRTNMRARLRRLFADGCASPARKLAASFPPFGGTPRTVHECSRLRMTVVNTPSSFAAVVALQVRTRLLGSPNVARTLPRVNGSDSSCFPVHHA